jgi:hypothetical protein
MREHDHVERTGVVDVDLRYDNAGHSDVIMVGERVPDVRGRGARR